MIDIKEALTEQELDSIYEYRRMYATAYSDDEDRGERVGTLVSSEELLEPWAESKELLYKAFGNKLILTKNFEYSISSDTIAENIYSAICRGKNIFDIRNVNTVKEAYQFYRAMNDAVRYQACGSDFETRNAMRALFSNTVLADNRVPEGYEFSYCGIKAQKGARVTKIIAKLAEHFGVSGFESFRLIHSLCLNNKKISGELCLSIHPLDYMTMSDNEEGWQSCMNWINNGCYRQGTVEMMNSKSVIVAYVKAKDNVNYGSIVNWNSKKWRQLFIVDEKIITGVKAYPYYNEDITRQALDWIKEIMSSTYSYYDNSVILPETDIRYDFSMKNGEETTNLTAGFCFSTGNMYNDFGSVENFPIYIGTNVRNSSVSNIYYSGRSQCMCCGREDVSESDSLLCNNCYEVEERVYCECCGERMYEGEVYYLEGIPYCRDCYDDHAVTPINRCGEDANRRYCGRLYFINSEGVAARADDEYGCSAYVYFGTSRYVEDFILDCGQIGIRKREYNNLYISDSNKIRYWALEGRDIFLRETPEIKDTLEISSSECYYDEEEIIWLTKENFY